MGTKRGDICQPQQHVFSDLLPLFSVRYALNSETGERVAIKIINKKKIGKTPGQIEQIEKEARKIL